MTSRITRSLRSTILLLALLLVGASTALAQTIGASLQNARIAAAPLDQLQVIVTFDGEGALNAGQLASLQAVGVTGFYFQSLPIAGVLATPAQIDQLAGLQGVRSLWLNEQLEWENDRSTALTGVDKLRNDPGMRNAMGLPYSGQGIGVLVNDSGVDGTHPDLKDNVVQNVAAQTNLASVSSLLPVTYTENVPNTDHGGGHGTHVAGIVAGTGAASGGKHEGVAPGANIIGYGSGAVIFILDTIGGFDYALTHQFQYNIRVVSNSFGSSSDSGTDFQPDHPTNVATKRLADRGIMVVFSAGNSGPGFASITGNYKKAPWVTLVAAGDSQGNLADFSSRGRIGVGGTYTDNQGNTYSWVDRPTVTAPGVDVISANASTGSMHDGMADEFQPFYTVASGTSMSCPHVSGIIALMLEADPTLNWQDVKDILEQTATNLSARADWEAGAGYVNAYAAVQETLARKAGTTADFGATVNAFRTFNASASVSPAGAPVDFEIFFNPVGEAEEMEFEVPAGTGIVAANANIGDNTVALVLYDPLGNRYGSSISLPVIGQTIGVTAPGVPGTWRVTARGIGSISGNRVDPLGLTNGYAAPGFINGQISFLASNYEGLGDIGGHEAEELIKYAVSKYLVDGSSSSAFSPDAALNRGDLANYLVMGTGVRQTADRPFSDVGAAGAPFAAAVAAQGAALRDTDGFNAGVMRTDGSSFNPNGGVSRASLAYSLIQSLGLQNAAQSLNDGSVSVAYMGEDIELSDWQDIPADLRGYVQLALDLNVMQAHFSLTQGAYDLQPTIHAAFDPNGSVSRAAYAWHITRFADSYLNGFTLPGAGEQASKTIAPITYSPVQETTHLEHSPAGEMTLDQNYPNPFNPSTQINFSVPESGNVRLAVYDLTGRLVQVLMDGNLSSGQHSARFDASRLASGRYLYRLETPTSTMTKSMLLIK
ncbi:MAG: S8 family peptidase [Rhodothermales bacterium]|nr:S8 family peptidase [Rhodothermales bacterium]MBO6779547.1 S8 family peptidase [Rhodothermales bacterium]